MGKGGGKGEGQGAGMGRNDRLACPALPLPAAIVCCILNIFIPGFGTILGGFINACCGDNKDMTGCDVCGGVCISILIGLAQLVLTFFGLAGWIWSIVWGVFMIGQSLDYKAKRQREANRDQPGHLAPGTGQVFIVTNTTYTAAAGPGMGPSAGPAMPPTYSPPMVPPVGGKQGVAPNAPPLGYYGNQPPQYPPPQNQPPQYPPPQNQPPQYPPPQNQPPQYKPQY